METERRESMSLFNENMTSTEAWKVLFATIDGKSKEERDRIMAEYKRVLPAIIKKELDGSPVLTSYQV